MKLRWTLLFYSTLAALIGMSWIAHTLDISLLSLMTMSLLGMLLGCVTAFLAMIRNIQDKAPAAVVLICAGPMALDVLKWIGDLAVFVRYVGPSILLVAGGAIGTAVVACSILVMKPPTPPREPPVAPARVVD